MAKKAGKGSDLNAVNSMTGKKVIGEFNEDFRKVLIQDMGHRGRVKVMKPVCDKQ